jgi:RNA polymerase I-specific transcription initiation factor RRN3
MMQKSKTLSLRAQLTQAKSSKITTTTTTILNNEITKVLVTSTQQQQQQKEEEYLNLKQILTNYLNKQTNSKYEYDYFQAQLKQKQNNTEFLRITLNNLKECIHFLEPTIFENLINSLFFDIKWYLHVDILNILNEFLTDLISAYTQYIYKCLQFLVKTFLVTKNTDPTIQINCKSYYQFSHSLILNLIKIAPTCQTHIIKLVDTAAPYMIKDTCVQEAYIENILQLATNIPTLRLKILEICVQKMLKIDVNAPRDQIINVELEPQAQQQLETIVVIETPIMKHPFGDRLDAMMVKIFEFIRVKCNSNNELDWEECKLVYKDLLFTFDKYILSTYGSSHVQFLLFYICSYRTNLSEGFLDYLWKKFSNPNTCPITRQLCTYYIGSFLSRANYIPLSTVIASMQLMCTWLHNYVDKIDASKSYPNIDLHRTFYALCQTVFYIFIFRHHELMVASNVETVKLWKFCAIVSNKLNPLRFCLPTITKKFASLARLYQLAYCYTIIDTNNRLTLPSMGDTGLAGCHNHASNASLRKFFNNTSIDSSFTNTTSTVDNSHSVNLIHQDNPLDSFFPFDPYLLTRSKVFIESFYQNYNSVNDDDNDGDGDDDEDDEMITDEEIDEDIADSDDDDVVDEKVHHNPWSEDDEI